MRIFVKIPVVLKNTQPLENRIFSGNVLFYIAMPNASFTLPAGLYDTDYPVDYLKPLKRRLKLYDKEWYKPLPKFEVHRSSNPHKASVFETGDVLLDASLYDSPVDVVRRAVLYHEIGHQFYKTESKCDHFAKEMLLNEGYNPAQIKAAFHATGLRSKDRICSLSNSLKKEKRL